jgi:hypothetical protein
MRNIPGFLRFKPTVNRLLRAANCRPSRQAALDLVESAGLRGRGGSLGVRDAHHIGSTSIGLIPMPSSFWLRGERTRRQAGRTALRAPAARVDRAVFFASTPRPAILRFQGGNRCGSHAAGGSRPAEGIAGNSPSPARAIGGRLLQDRPDARAGPQLPDQMLLPRYRAPQRRSRVRSRAGSKPAGQTPL